VDNYRGITLTAVISKLFELISPYVNCEDKLCFDELQFSFKESVGCQHAVFTLRTICEYFNDQGSTVFAAGLDIM
jgi:hypothetical protein